MKTIKERFKNLAKSNSVLAAGTASGFGLAIAGGTCAAGVCTIAVFPVVSFLSTIGLGALSPWLPLLRIPLILLSILLGAIVIRNVNRQGSPLKSSLTGLALGGTLVFSISQAFYNQSQQRDYPSVPQETHSTHCNNEPTLLEILQN